MAQIKYTKDHEYIRLDGDIGTVGITDHAQQKLGDVTYVELPAKGKGVKQGEAAGVVESVKAASDVYAPVSGTIVEINAELAEKPELVNQDPEGAAWFFKIALSNPSEFHALMDRDAYLAHAAAEE